MSKTSVKIVELESVKQLSTTPLNSLKQGQTWQRPVIETRYVKELWIPKNIFFAYFFVIWTIQHCTNLWWNHRNSIILQNFHCFRFSAVHQLHYWDQINDFFFKAFVGRHLVNGICSTVSSWARWNTSPWAASSDTSNCPAGRISPFNHFLFSFRQWQLDR